MWTKIFAILTLDDLLTNYIHIFGKLPLKNSFLTRGHSETAYLRPCIQPTGCINASA
jgi:hypothetical protein